MRQEERKEEAEEEGRDRKWRRIMKGEGKFEKKKKNRLEVVKKIRRKG